MTTLRAFLIVVVSTTPFPMIAEDKTDTPKTSRSIELKPSKPQFDLGAAIDLRVVYSNPTDTVWKLEQPESSAGVKVWYEPVRKAESARMGFSFSKMTSRQVRLPDGRQQIVYTAPPQVEITIQPGKMHELKVDIYSRWTEDLAPGEYEVWVEDAGQELKSNRCSFTLAFNKESVPHLLATAAAEKESPFKRKWCARWLERIQPGFALKLPAANDPPAALQAISAHNAKVIEDFKAHWEKVKDSREIEALFAKAAPKTGLEHKPQAERKAGSP